MIMTRLHMFMQKRTNTASPVDLANNMAKNYGERKINIRTDELTHKPQMYPL